MPYTAMFSLTKPVLRRALWWVALSFALNLLWETAQSPLYVFPGARGIQVAYSILHCTVGDVFISFAGFLLAGFSVRDPDWPFSRPWMGGAIATVVGLLYTVYSEWNNVSQLGSWGYTSAMPLILGIGVAPVLQWLVLPLLTVLCLRKISTADKRAQSSACTGVQTTPHREAQQQAPK